MLTVHHLQHSQSERILWLLEELSIPYEVVLHQRAPLLAPESIKSLHPQGTAPILIDGDLTLSESGAIATYIIEKYGHGRLTAKPTDANYTTYLYWLYFTLCTLQPAGSAAMFAFLDKSIADDAMVRQFTKQRLQKNLGLVEKRLGEAPCFAGDDLSLVDIMAVWCFTTHRDFLPYSLKDYPNIVKYVERMTSREAYKKAWEKGEGQWQGITRVEPEKKAVF